MVVIKEFKNGKARTYMSSSNGRVLVNKHESLEKAIAENKRLGFEIHKINKK